MIISYQNLMDNHVYILESVKEERDLGIVIADDLQVAYNKDNGILGI